MSDESIFAEALAIPNPAAREEYLAAACAGNADLRREVDALLAAHAGENPLDRPPEYQVATELTDEGPPPAEVGDTIGPYRLMEQIGEGGFGLVFVAEQHEPVRRKVALKVLKPGMDTRDVVARFEAERQALALMDHPNIAKVLDAGSTPNGRPYFVMELVKGIPINQYCDEQRLSPTERLELFAQVCQAVQHAHQKGIIHRDIKPTNVLVTVIDGKPVPKVIDFGVAKAVGQNLTERTIYTRFAQMVGTPLYMSPEQAQLSGVDVDTRSDIYSLGVLLYELLTGTTPYDSKRFRTAALEEIRRIIREEDPPRPSHRLSSLGETLPSISANRKTEPARLPGLIRGELDWIVMKCLEKDRDRRYETANGLARDVQRYLTGEAVEACPPTWGYRLRKAYRRNRAAVLTTLSFAAVLLVATGVSISFGVQANRAQRETDKSLKVAKEKTEEATVALAAEHAAREDLQSLNYARSIQLAYQYWLDDNVGETVRLLDQARLEFRGWEWNYLHRLCHSDRLTLKVSNNGVLHAEFSRDGSKIVTADEDGHLTIWDAASGAHIKTISHGDRVTRPSFNHDGSRIVAIHSFDVSTQTRGDEYPSWHVEILIWDVKTEEHITLQNPDPRAYEAEFSYDGSQIVTTQRDNTVGVWDAGTGERLFLLERTPDEETPAIRFIDSAFAPEGSRILAVGGNSAGSGYGAITVWNADAREVLIDQKIVDDVPIFAGWSLDGNRIVVAFRSGAIGVLDTATGDFLQTLAGQHNQLNSAEFSPDGDRIVTRNSSQVFTIWDATTGEVLKQLKGHTNTVSSAKFSPDGKRIVTASADGTVKVWDAEAGYRPLVFPDPREQRGVRSLVFSPDSTRIATGSGGAVIVRDAATGAEIHKLDLNARYISTLEFAPGGKRLLIAYRDNTELIQRKITVWETETDERLEVKLDHRQTVHATTFSLDGRWIVTASRDKTAKIWDATTGDLVRTLSGHTWSVSSATFSPDSQWVLTSAFAHDGTARIWNAATGQELVRFEGHRDENDGEDVLFAVWSAVFSPDGTKVVSIGNRKTIVWDANTGQEILTLDGITDGGSVVFSPDGKRIVTDSDTGVSIWDAETGHLLLNLKSTSEMVGGDSFALSPDGSRIAFYTIEGVEIHDSRPFPHNHAINP